MLQTTEKHALKKYKILSRENAQHSVRMLVVGFRAQPQPRLAITADLKGHIKRPPWGF